MASHFRAFLVAQVALATMIATVLPASVASADPQKTAPLAVAPSTAAREEAKDRFDRGLTLFNEGDNAGALSEFKRAYELVPNQAVLLNIGLTYGAMRRPVEAVETLDAVLADPSGLSMTQQDLAQRTRDDQARRIALLEIVTNVPANLSIDGVEVAWTPLAQPLRVAQGTHVIAAAAPDRLPRNQEITVAGGEQRRVELELPPTSTAAAQLSVSSSLAGVEVRVDGVSAGKTPFAASLTVEPGQRLITAHRPGYRDETRELELSRGGTARVHFVLTEDPAASADLRGQLRLSLNEPVADVFIDDAARGPYEGPLTLPIGEHKLRVEREGFEPLERTVHIAPGQTTEIAVALSATAATRTAHAESVRTQRTWGLIGVIAGVAIGGAGATLALVSESQRGDAQDRLDELLPQYERGSGGRCDPATSIRVLQERGCAQALSQANQDVDRHSGLRDIGWVGAGVGAAVAIAGAIVMLTAGDADKYDGGATASRALALHGYVGAGIGGAVLSGSF